MIMIVAEFLSGSYYPLDVFPSIVFNILRFTPFPYLVFIPIKLYLGSFSTSLIIQSLVIGGVWSIILWKVTNHVWKRGLLVYEGVGR